jgi:hypothetical protein
MILIGLLIVLPLLGAQLGMNLNFVSQLISVTANAVIQTILRLTGNIKFFFLRFTGLSG